MVDRRNAKRIEKLKKAMKKERGYIFPEWVYIAENDVAFTEAYNNFYEAGLTDGKALRAKTRELIAIGILAYRGLNNAVYEHSKRALRLGATKQELLEAIETAAVPGGGPTLAAGLQALVRIEEDERKGK